MTHNNTVSAVTSKDGQTYNQAPRVRRLPPMMRFAFSWGCLCLLFALLAAATSCECFACDSSLPACGNRKWLVHTEQEVQSVERGKQACLVMNQRFQHLSSSTAAVNTAKTPPEAASSEWSIDVLWANVWRDCQWNMTGISKVAITYLKTHVHQLASVVFDERL